MPSTSTPHPGRSPRRAGVLLAATVAAAAIVLMLTITAGAAVGSATLTSTRSHLNGPSGRRTEPIVTNARGVAVYWLGGDSARHPECTAANGCFGFWPPVKLARGARLNRTAAVKGRLGTFRRDGFTQVTLNGHPLYTFSQDANRRASAGGDGVQSFGGTWHVIATGPARAAATAPAAAGGSSSGSGW